MGSDEEPCSRQSRFPSSNPPQAHGLTLVLRHHHLRFQHFKARLHFPILQRRALLLHPRPLPCFRHHNQPLRPPFGHRYGCRSSPQGDRRDDSQAKEDSAHGLAAHSVRNRCLGQALGA
ncbi:hypothetical protein LINPERHAP1_LOCUS41073 [Linum perenne]